MSHLSNDHCGQEKLVRAMSNPGFFQKDSGPVDLGQDFPSQVHDSESSYEF